MAPRPLHRFWRTLEELPEQTTEQRDWQQRLAEDWLPASRLLRSTGRLARAIACPDPGGDGCPMKVVDHGKGRLVAVCGGSPARCEAFDLAQADIEVIQLDGKKLATTLRRLLGLAATHLSHPIHGDLIGMLPILAGVEMPVVLMVQGGRAATSVESAPPAAVDGVVLTPIKPPVEPRYVGWRHVPLADLVGVDEQGSWALLPSGQTRIETAKASALTLAQATDEAAWRLPADTTWEEIVIEFISDEVINVRFRGTTKRFEPEHLSMKDQRHGQPTEQWAVLKLLAENRGELPLPVIPKKRDYVRKQKQTLSEKLRQAFGIVDEPIPYRKREGVYRARFVIRPHRLGGPTQNENSS